MSPKTRRLLAPLHCGFSLFLCLLLSAHASWNPEAIRRIDDTIEQAVTDARTPGAVFLLGHGEDTYLRAYGFRSLTPELEPCTTDTVYDLASLTKVVATTTAIMILLEEKKLELDRPVSHDLPEFSGPSRDAITLRHLLTHTSGLRSGIGWPLHPPPGLRALDLCAKESPLDPPGSRFRYSDINFILLGYLVEKAGDLPLDRFCQQRIFGPLGMKETAYRPLETLKIPVERIAPTSLLPDGSLLRGVVHDPTARRMNGVAGHAGLFSTAADLHRFASMILQKGTLGETRILQASSVELMTSIQSPPNLPRRGLGWDIASPYSTPRGRHFPLHSFGHTGWTGTRLWIDPSSSTITLLLANRVHPDDQGNVLSLYSTLGTLSAEAIPDPPFALQPESPAPARALSDAATLTGIDVLQRDQFRQLRGRNIGLITNHTGVSRRLVSTIDLLHQAPHLRLVKLFSPEHGIRGALDHDGIADSKDPATGLVIHSLYGKHRTPTPEQLEGLTTIVFDIQDIGCRFYTYISTMANAMEAAERDGLEFIVLDRPNPLGPATEGPALLAPASFVAAYDLPLRHGMTVGEIARLIHAERRYTHRLGVIRCEGGSPLRWPDQTGQPWINPSPNMRTPYAALLYPGVGLLEFCQLSVGRGTDTPFEVLGAPGLDEFKLAARLNQASLPGLRFLPLRFTPSSSKFSGKECRGVRILVTDRDAVLPVELGLHLAHQLQEQLGSSFKLQEAGTLLGHPSLLKLLLEKTPPQELPARWQEEHRSFLSRRQPFLLYPRP